jgi:hypothetical protein
MEIALKAGRGYAEQVSLFEQNGWHLTDARQLRTFDEYRDYIAASRAEFSIGNNRYVEFHTGWFSDRSARYLAAGKPVLVQSTGFEEHLPTGEGLLAFRSLEEAAAMIDEINRDYTAHCHAARRIAEEYFDSNRVLTRMLQEIGVQEYAHVA